MSIILKKGEIRSFKCVRCDMNFERIVYPNQIANRVFKRNYCSRECLFQNGHAGTKKMERIKKACGYCQKTMLVGPWTLRRGKGKFCSAICRIKSVTMERTVASDGYYIILRDGKRVREHRAVMSDLLGRKLKTEETVHHVNCDKLDNRPENLFLCSRYEHGRIHASLERVIRTLMKAGMVEFAGGIYRPTAGISRVGHVLAE